MKTIVSQIQGAQQITSTVNKKRTISSIIMQLENTKGKGNILEAIREKRQIPDKQTDN